MSEDVNNQLVLISGESASGKSTSLMNIRDQPDWLYLGCEAGKRLPFRNKFNDIRISDPYQVYEGFDAATGDGELADETKGIIIDTSTYLMDMYESQYVLPSSNGQKAWSDYAQYWKNLLQTKVVLFEKPVIILAHTKTSYDKELLANVTCVPVKGALANNGIESYFSTVVSTKKMTLKDLEPYENDLLTITEDDEILGYKHVFQTRLTKATNHERIRSPMGLFSREETYINNDAQLLLDRLNDFYN